MSEENPYRAPSVEVQHNEHRTVADLSGPRSVGAGQGWQWLVEGFAFFAKNPGAWVVAVILWFILLTATSLVPILGGIAVSVFGPVVLAGFMLGVQAQANGKEFEIGHIFAGFTNVNFGQLLLIGILYFVAVTAIAVMVGIMFAGILAVGIGFELLDTDNPAATIALLSQLAVPILVMLALFVPIIMMYWFSPVLTVVHGMPAIEAIKFSFKGCLMNITPFLVYGVLVLVFSVLALIPLGLGYLVLAPVVTASVYAAYRDIFIG